MDRVTISPAVIWRLVLGVALIVIAASCGSTGGCQGCTTQPIPGGFDQKHRMDNGMQVRLSSTGVDFMEKNFEDLVGTLVPGGLSFTIPPTGCSGSGNQKICCSGPPCNANMDITSVNITPTPKSTAKLALRAKVKTSTIKFEQYVLLGWVGCDVDFDSARSGQPDLGLNADVDFVVDPTDDNKLKISRGTTTITDFDSGDIDISGGIHCTVVNWLKSLFKGTIEDALMGMVDDTVDAMLKDLPMGQEGRFDVATFLSAFSPRTTGVVDYFLWAGGYSQAEQGGMSIGVMSGFRAAKHNPCVPDCEVPGATCAPPATSAITRSQTLRGNDRPGGQPFDVGIGVHRQALDVAAYAMYSSGGLCLDIATSSSVPLTSSMFALLIPSLNALTGGENLPMMLSIRPRNPASITLGKGTYHTDQSGKVVIDDPLLKINAKDFAADVYVQLEERMVRVFTIVGDLEVPALLYPDADGKLQIIIGDLSKALTNIKVENADLIKEDPQTLAGLFPTLMGLAATFLAGGFEPIALPSLSGIELKLGPDSITTIDSNELLAIYADLAMVKNTSLGASADTRATLEELQLPGSEAFRLGAGGPRVTLRLGADLPPSLAGLPVEYSYRVDGGFFRPWTDGDRLVVQDPLLWLQGRHAVEVMARVKGLPATLDRSPAVVPVTIDTVAPRVRIVPTATGVRAVVEDAVSPPESVQLSWSVNGAAFGPFGAARELELPRGAEVAVRARDPSGNIGHATLGAGGLSSPGAPADSEGGCAVGGSSSGAMALGLLLLLALIALHRGRE
jgi:hypothetical protein